jgi:pilus assembly protein Flp/PilA
METTHISVTVGGRPAIPENIGREVNHTMFETIMASIYRAFASAREREEGQALVEYALILALVSVVSVGALTLLGGNVNTVLNSIAGSV